MLESADGSANHNQRDDHHDDCGPGSGCALIDVSNFFVACHGFSPFMAWVIGSHEPTCRPRGQGQEPCHNGEPQDDVGCGPDGDLDG